ncbi:MAG: hypothetical protein AMXMBFR7_33510 [Planctomycetota bacterium]
MTRAAHCFASLALCAVLAGCGGGGDGPPDPKILAQLIGSWEGEGPEQAGVRAKVRVEFRADGTVKQVLESASGSTETTLKYLFNTAHVPYRLDFIGKRHTLEQVLLIGIAEFPDPDTLRLRSVPMGVPRAETFDEKKTAVLKRVKTAE